MDNEYKIQPLFFPWPDWDGYIAACQNNLGYSPMRELDGLHMSKDDPCSFYAALEFGRDVIQTLESPLTSPAARHYVVGFLAVVPAEVLQLLALTGLTTTARKGRRDYLIIISGSLNQWVWAMEAYLIKNGDLALRSFLSACLIFLKMGSFKRAFAQYEELLQADGTIILKRRK